MSPDVTCETLREIGAELALGVLHGRERAEAVAHLERCADCRRYVEELTLVGDGLIGLVPAREPPVGFETRVARSLAQAAAARDGGGGLRRLRLLRKGFPGRVRLGVASAAAALALAAGFGGWAIGTALENQASPSRPTQVVPGVMLADLTTIGPRGESAGKILAHPGTPGWLYVSIDLEDIGYSGKVHCLLERKNGTTVPVGTFALHDGYGSWQVPLTVEPTTLAGAHLTDPDGTVIAKAHFHTTA
ncbi:hypothetical protein [Streptomyces sp. NPDC046805]|uniref:hypothetical protein n=1 Tax=Streptomyces sp. NPDC046805 TaxID=3155134 RepID=UPI00340041DB